MSVIRITRGDDAERTVTVTLAGEPVNLETAQAVRFTAKRQLVDPDSAAVLAYDLDGGITVDANVATIAFAAEDTRLLDAARLYADLEVTDVDGDVATVWVGFLAIDADVTRDPAAIGS